MSPDLDVLQEISTPPAVIGTKSAISWSGDGEFCAILSTDAEDNLTRIRIYSKVFDLLSVGRGVMDGAGEVVTGLCNVVSFAPTGSLIASVQKKNNGRYQVLFLVLV